MPTANTPQETEAQREALEERSAIREFMGGEPREVAEAEARKELGL